MLRLADGQVFTSGRCSYRFRPASEADLSHRIVLPIQVEQIETEAVLDTGAMYLICTPELASLLNLDPQDGMMADRLRIRGHPIQGTLHRLTLTLLASEGDDYALEVTAFVPDPDPLSQWDSLPAFLGVQNCLDGIRFAVDPAQEQFYFGPVVWG